MSRRLRRNVPSATSTFTKTQRILIITLASVLALGGVVVSQSAALRERLGLPGSKSSPAQQPPSPTAARNNVDRPKAGVKRAPGQLFSLTSPVAPTVSATKTDSLFTDVDGDLQADPGDTLKYTVTINASGEDATGVTFTDTVDPNTAFVGGTLRATPVAVDDSYSATGNVRISVAAPGVLGNDFAGIPNAAITAPPVTSANGGNVTLNADGSFTYNPPAGFEGTDSFSYTLTNSEGSNSATVTINVSGMIWFINNTASCPCDGRLTNPFNTLASFAAVNNGVGNNPAANDNIFLYESAIDYVGPVTLLNGQRFIGQDATASLSSITGLTPPAGSDPLPVTNSGNATIVNITSASTAITVAFGNNLVGFTGGDAVTDISGTSFGTLTISDVTLNGTGQALNLTTGTLAATFGSISSTNSATTGISLTSVGGSLTTPTTTITNPTGIGISVNTSSATLNFGNTSSTGSGGTGVSLLTNTGTITFGTLTITPDANQRGLLATDNSMTLTSTGGAISTTGAIAIEITRASGTTPLAISETNVSANGGSRGIFLSNTSGGFTVTGSGTPNSGGTIQNMTGADDSSTTPVGSGIVLNNATNVSLTRVHVANHTNYGVHGQSVTGFTLDNSLIDGANGTNGGAPFNDGSVTLKDLTGSATVSNTTIQGGFSDNFRIVNTTGTLDRITFDNATFEVSGTTPGNDALTIESSSTAVVKVTVQNSFFKSAAGDLFQLNNIGSGTDEVIFTGNTLTNAHPAIASGGGGVTIGGGSTSFDINGNSFRDAVGHAVLIVKTTDSNTLQGSFAGNTIGVAAVANSGSKEGDGLKLQSAGGGTVTVSITNNSIHQTNNFGIEMLTGGSATPQSGNYNATISGNLIDTPGNNAGTIAIPKNGIHLNGGTVPGDTYAICAQIGGAGALANSIATSGADSVPPTLGDIDIRLRQRQATTVRLPGYAGANNDNTAVQNFLIANNSGNGAPVALAANTVPTGGGYVGGASCSSPVVPMMTMSAPTAEMATKAVDPEQEIARPSGGTESDDVLRAAGGEGHNDYIQKLRQEELVGLVQTAIQRWREAGISLEDVMRLQALTFEVTDLPDGQLAITNSTSVKIDETAAGYGWYFDLTPMADEEFDVPVRGRELQTTEQSVAFGRMDLLTVVMRQLGVAYQQGRKNLPKQLLPLMQNTLSPAVRRLPDSRNIKLPSSQARVSGKNQPGRSLVSRAGKASALRSKTGVSTSPVSFTNAGFNPIAKTASRQPARLMNHAPRNRTTPASLSSMLADVMLNIGTLPAGESVTITFNVTVDDPFTGALPQVSNQGTVSGSNFADVLTDDPTVGGTADPTVTPIDLPQVTLAVSPASVLEDGATNLVYTFTRNGSTANPMTVNFSVGGTASFTEPDYTQSGAATFTATSGTVVIPGGSSTATVTIDPSADTTVEPDETVVLTVTSGTGYSVGSPSSATGTILNDDNANTVTALGPANFWVGLKNSDDVGLRFDFLVEVYRNGQLIGTGQLDNQAGGSSSFNNAILRTVAIIQSQPASFLPGDQLSVKLSVRAGPTGHVSGYARLWYNDAAANSRFDVALDGNPNTYYLLDGFVLGSAAGPGPKKTIDVLVNRNQNGNAFQPFGTWVKTF